MTAQNSEPSPGTKRPAFVVRAARKPDAAMSFEFASSTEAEPAAVYDAIFAMAVLRHGSLGPPGVTRCDHLIQFDEFARAVEDFERCLKPGGLLVIRHNNFDYAICRPAPPSRRFCVSKTRKRPTGRRSSGSTIC
jgi:hypothetical protein